MSIQIYAEMMAIAAIMAAARRVPSRFPDAVRLYTRLDTGKPFF